MTKNEALNLALKALETLMIERGSIYDKAITAIKEALAQPEPWEKFCDSNCVWTDHHPDCKLAEQKPVALETVYETIIQWDEGGGKRSRRELARRIVSLYTTPPQRKPLTNEEIANTLTGYRLSDAIDITRAIEAAHGIKGEA